MAKYSVVMTRTASATLGVGSIEADDTRPRRGKLYEVVFGSSATAGDGNFLFVVERVTAAGSEAGTAATPNPLDPADAATEADGLQNLTVNPTVGVRLLSKPLNQRTTYRWHANFGSELVYPATASNGFILQTPTAGSLVTVDATVLFEEQ